MSALPTQGFVDLRVHPGRDGSYNDDSVWPSFTDIMTVVVMIFLMALVVILLRNVELVQQLRATMEAERSAAATKDALSVRLERLERLVVDLRENLTESERVREQSTAQLTEQDQALASLRADIAGLEALRQKLVEENTRLGRDYAALSDRYQTLQLDRDDLARQQVIVIGRLENLEAERDELTADRDRLQSQYAELASSSKALETERDTLLVRGDDLAARVGQLEEVYASLLAERDMLVVEKSELEQRNRQVSGRSEELRLNLEELRLVYALLEEEKATLERAQAETLARQNSLQDRLADSDDRQRALSADNEQLKGRIRQLLDELSEAESGYRQRDEQLASLRADFSSLQQRYDRLVRPARSPNGRYVVEIRYLKRGEQNVIEMREPGEASFRVVTQEALYGRLDELSASREEGLYTRIILPEESGLSFNEAWDFTNDVLNRYDYYYQ